MDFELEIDAQLDALSDCSLDDSKSFESEVDDIVTELDFKEKDDDQVDWMKLFLNRTNEQNTNIDNNLCDVEVVLKEIDKNVLDCHMQTSMLSITDDNKKDFISTDSKLVTIDADDVGDEIKTFNQEISATDTVEQQNNNDDKCFEKFETLYQQEYDERIDHIEVNRLASQKQISDMEEVERKILQNLMEEKRFYENERKNKAACRIQSSFRRYLVRRKHGHELDERLRLAKEERTRRRIQFYDDKRKELENSLPVSDIETATNTNQIVVSDDEVENENNIDDNMAESSSSIDDQIDPVDVAPTPEEQELRPENPTDIHLIKQNETKTEVAASFNSTSNDVNDHGDAVEKKDTVFITSYNDDSDRSRDIGEKSRNHDSVNSALKSWEQLNDDVEHNEHSYLSSSSSSHSEDLDVEKHGADDEIKQSNVNTVSAINEDLKHLAKSVAIHPDESIVNEMSENISSSPDFEQNDVNSINKELSKKKVKDFDSTIIESSPKSSFSKIEEDIALLQKSVYLAPGEKEEPSVVNYTDEYDADADEDNNKDDQCDDSDAEEDNNTDDQCDADVVNNNDDQCHDDDAEIVKNIDDQCHDDDAKDDSNDQSDDDTTQNYNINNDNDTGKKSSDEYKKASSLDQNDSKIKSLIETNNTFQVDTLQITSSQSSEQNSELFDSKQMDDKLDSISINEAVSSSQDDDVINIENSHAEDRFDSNVVSTRNNEADTINEIELPKDSVKSISTDDVSHKKTMISNTTNENFTDALLPNTKGNESTPKTSSEPNLVADELKHQDIVSPAASSSEKDTHLFPQKSSDLSTLYKNNKQSTSSNYKDISDAKYHPSPQQSHKEASFDNLNSNSDEVNNHNSAVHVKLSDVWKRWKKSSTPWEAATPKVSKPQLRRTIRKSSAARKLPPFTEEEIVQGKWPFFKDQTDQRTVHSLSRIYLSSPDNLGKNLINIQRCANLTHLTLIHCGLVSIEGLQPCPCLKHVDVSHNNITVVSCDGMKRLESLVIMDNRLTSIHGLTGCGSLLLLDASDNNITKINGLDEVSSLAHLRLCKNQLIYITGLCVVTTLLSLDVSHNNLSSLEGIEKCGLLRVINASANSFTSIPYKNLTNAILLFELDLSENSISSLLPLPSDTNEDLFLPLLSALYLQRNKISVNSESDVPNFQRIFPNLLKINLSKNLISACDPMIEKMKTLPNFKQLNLSENLLSKQQEDEVLTTYHSSSIEVIFDDNFAYLTSGRVAESMRSLLIFSFLSDTSISFNELEADSYSRMIAKHLNKFVAVISNEDKEVKNLKGWKTGKATIESVHDVAPPDIFSCHCGWLKKLFELAVQHRFSQESKHFDHSRTTSSTAVERITEEKITVSQQSSNVQDSLHVPGRCDDLHVDQTLSHNTEHFEAVPPRSSNTSSILNSSLHASFSTTSPTVQCTVLNDSTDKLPKTSTFYVENKILKRRVLAATLIQALWRGFLVRRNLRNAFASINTSDEVVVEDFEEINLSELEFDDAIYEQQWAVRTNNLPLESPIPHQRSYSADASKRSFKISVDLTNQARLDHVTDPQPLEGNSQSIWTKLASIDKPPLPPITPTGSTVSHTDVGDSSSSMIDSYRSKHSKKEEVLANEWGLRSSTAAELMLKRARRMKGRKKKQVNADEKLKRFQDLKQKMTEQPLPHVKKPHSHQRLDYFKAREIGFEKNEKKLNDDDERRRQYTYEWLHTSATCTHDDPCLAPSSGQYPPTYYSTRRHKSDGGSIKSGFLPQISQHRSATNSAQNNQLEILSLSSRSSNPTRSKHLLRDIARRHGA